MLINEKLEKQYGSIIANKIIEGYKVNRKTTFRVNRLKSNLNEIIDVLNKNRINYKKVNWFEDAFIIEDINYDIRKLEIYESGKIYLQSLSSMIPPVILNPKKDENILDMTAAPGGKTTQILSISNNLANVTACEKNKIRCEKMQYNINKQGATRVNVLNQDSIKLDDFFSFDKILLDAPCSGSGTINLHNEKYFTNELVERSKKIQQMLLEKAIKILKNNGELVYSTCSILQEENEENIEKILQKYKNIEIAKLPDIKELPNLKTKIDGTICVCPNEEYEGFFVAKLIKKEN